MLKEFISADQLLSQLEEVLEERQLHDRRQAQASGDLSVDEDRRKGDRRDRAEQS